MPIEHEPYALDTHVPVIAVLAEQLQQEAEAALAATTETDQIVRVAGLQALGRALTHEVDLLLGAVRPAAAEAAAAEED